MGVREPNIRGPKIRTYILRVVFEGSASRAPQVDRQILAVFVLCFSARNLGKALLQILGEVDAWPPVLVVLGITSHNGRGGDFRLVSGGSQNS